ncbi:tetratricopeptide repeat protein [Candidatus Fukatsuia symbiotica]|uniref:Uncharacterized protein n=1 Tax=Candidatus Fukatsuia symbiotica TaxID=1878942 RepID=A0A2U8I4C1_9GAMM|nr:tetratricopeptide repeat protein [Candidatus Fukatsuia symbiotica]AWK13987.1 hypothetical protein CCS41_05025 [Candidatus Fukatsuia symbiotica]MEA9445668.1 tetratricopeptide repeat protein [Candidatus Fukatsuia symbiotica]
MSIHYKATHHRENTSLTEKLARLAVHDNGSLDAKQLYARGYQAWQEENYAAALVDFSWLALNYPYERRFHLAMAGALQMEKEYIAALACYHYAQTLEPCDPEPIYQMAICLQKLGEGTDAREALQTAIEMSYCDPAYAVTREKANRLLAEI